MCHKTKEIAKESRKCVGVAKHSSWRETERNKVGSDKRDRHKSIQSVIFFTWCHPSLRLLLFSEHYNRFPLSASFWHGIPCKHLPPVYTEQTVGWDTLPTSPQKSRRASRTAFWVRLPWWLQFNTQQGGKKVSNWFSKTVYFKWLSLFEWKWRGGTMWSQTSFA